MILIAAMAMMGAAATPPPASSWPAPACKPYLAGGGMAEGARIGAALDREWPAAWRSRGKLADIDIAPAEIARTVAALACIATWPGQESAAIEAATPLFGSKRHGGTAFAATDALARGAAVSGPMRAAAHGFRARMRHAVAYKYDKV